MSLIEDADSVPARPPALRSIVYVAAGAWGVFGLMSLLVAVDATTGVDGWVQHRIASAAPHLLRPAPWLGSTSEAVARLGSLPVAIGLIVAVSAVFAVWRRTLVPAILLGVSFFCVAAAVGGLKDLYHRPEPYDQIGALGFSYPSGHAAVAIAAWGGTAAVVMLFSRRRWSRAELTIAGVCACVALSVGAAMVARSAHWLSDVVGGVALGIGWLATVAVALAVIGWLPATWVRRRSAEADVAVRTAEPVGVDQ